MESLVATDSTSDSRVERVDGQHVLHGTAQPYMKMQCNKGCSG